MLEEPCQIKQHVCQQAMVKLKRSLGKAFQTWLVDSRQPSLVRKRPMKVELIRLCGCLVFARAKRWISVPGLVL
jgi:hypothetical protein